MVKVAFVVGDYPPAERKRREEVALSYSTAGVEVGIVSVAATAYLHGLTPAEIQLAATPFIEAFRDAERQGYDAVVPLGMLDLGVDGGRSAVDIPVIGPCEASLYVASLLGDRIGGIVYHDKLLPMTRAIVRRHGMEHKIAGWRTSGFDLPDLAANHDAVVRNFVEGARALVKEHDADVIIPMEGILAEVLASQGIKEIDGAVIMDGIGVPVMVAEMNAKLWKRTGTRVGRHWTYERADAATMLHYYPKK